MTRKFGMMRLLFNKDGGGDGGSRVTSLLNTDGNKSSPAVPPAKGNQDSANAGGKSGGDQTPAGGAAVASWISSLPKELQEDATIKKFTNVEGLAKSYLNAQKLLGADKIPVPSQHATEEDWQNVFKKLGLPDSVDKYDVKFGDQATIDEDFQKQFKEQALKSGILPKQAQQVADWFSKLNAGAEAKILETRKAQIVKDVKDLQVEWGQAFDQKLQYANAALAKYADPKTMEYLGKTGLANDTKLVRLLATMGEALFKEGTIPDGGSGGSGKLTPAEAMKQAKSIIQDKLHPYNIAGHLNHKEAVKEVAALFEQASQKVLD